MDRKRLIGDALREARQRSLDLLLPLDDDDLLCQHSPLMSPLAWDLAHLGNYEDQWLLGAVADTRARADLDDMYDAFRHPRKDRPSLPMLRPDEARAYIALVRERVLEALDKADLDRRDLPLLHRGFVYGLVLQHEHQHIETMLATLQLRVADYPPAHRYSAEPASSTTEGATAGAARLPEEVLVTAGPFEMGTDTDPWAYDNERPAHVVDLPAFWIDTMPVANRAYAEFIDDGGYDRPELWDPVGWAWRREVGLEAPQFWVYGGVSAGWSRDRFGRREQVPPDEPVQHVCWYEADAYARWAGKRLPTEAEWEKAAAWGPDGGRRRYPWGDDEPTPQRCNLWTEHSPFAPTSAGSYADGASAWGCRQILGDVWEWTASDFSPYPDFAVFPYREYSEVFFGRDYKVLRGGSWATHPVAVRNSFRNWDYPVRRQIFSGFRCARDA